MDAFVGWLAASDLHGLDPPWMILLKLALPGLLMVGVVTSHRDLVLARAHGVPEGFRHTGSSWWSVCLNVAESRACMLLLLAFSALWMLGNFLRSGPLGTAIMIAMLAVFLVQLGVRVRARLRVRAQRGPRVRRTSSR
jgi:hypothetical protein